MNIKTGIGQDSHRFDFDTKNGCILGGIEFPNSPALQGNSDSDVVLHAIINALTGIHTKIVLGPITDKMCHAGITDSEKYVEEALKYLNGFSLNHVSISIECSKPKIVPKADAMRANIARILSLSLEDIALTATTGEGLTDFGKGLGIQCFVIITASDTQKLNS